MSGIRQARTGKKTAPTRFVLPEGATIPQFYGYVTYNDGFRSERTKTGFYALPTQAEEEGTFVTNKFEANACGVAVDGVYYSVDYWAIFGMVFVTVNYYDLETGEILQKFTGDIDNICISGLAYDDSTDTIYGIGYNSEGDGLQFSTVRFRNNHVEVTPICPLNENYNSLVIDSKGQLYGIAYTGHYDDDDNFIVESSSLKKIDKKTGAATLVGPTGMVPQYGSSAVIDKETDRCYWNLCTPDGKTYMCEVNLATGAATPLFQLALNDQIKGMCDVRGATIAGKAPGKCQNVTLNFPEGSLTGNVQLTTPATLYDGSAGSGTLNVDVYVDGEKIASRSAGWNSPVTIDLDFTDKGPGEYDIYLFASNDSGAGQKSRFQHTWIGPDTPAATKATLNYTDGNMNLTWTPVETTANGGWFNTANLTYKVVRNDGITVADGLKTTSFSEPMAETEDVTTVYYSVYAVCDGLVSRPGRSNQVMLGSVTPPYRPDFDEDGMLGFTLIDVDGDGYGWDEWAGRIEYESYQNIQNDDWAITPPLKLEAGKAYLVTFNYWNGSDRTVEKLEVRWGADNTVEGMTETLLPTTPLSGGVDNEKSLEKYIIAETSGKYYIGFHAMSDPSEDGTIRVSDISVSAGVSSAAPGAATDVVLTPDPSGARKATVSFTTPDKTIAGKPLTSLNKVEILRVFDYGEPEPVKTFDNPGVGKALTFTDNVDADGIYEYRIVGHNANGTGATAKASAFIGINYPQVIAHVSIRRTENTGEVELSWDAVTQDIDGKPLDAGRVSYEIYDSNDNLIAETSATTYRFQAVSSDSQDLVQCSVAPKTAFGSWYATYTEMIPVGAPFAGIAESFADGYIHYPWGAKPIGDGTVGILPDDALDGISSQDGDKGFLALVGQTIDSGVDFFSGMVSLDGMENPGLTFYLFNIKGDDGTTDDDIFTVSARTIDSETWTPLLTGTVDGLCNGKAGWNRICADLGAYAGKVIQIQFTGISRTYTYKLIDNIRVASLLNNDLAALRIDAPARVKTGENYKVDVRVSNEGMKEASGISVELYADDSVVATASLDRLAAGESKIVTFDVTMPAIATESLSLYAKVVYAADENPGNNKTESLEVSPIASKLPTATGLEAENTDEGVRMTWNRPDLENDQPVKITEDFEDAEPFASEYGDWTFIDGDCASVGGFQGLDVPGIVPGTTKGSYWVWDNDQLGNFTFSAHSGSKYLFTLYRADGGRCDEWAISPELPGIAQVISFYARSYSAEYPETIEVYYSTGGKSVSDFIRIDGVGGEVPAAGGNTEADFRTSWTRYSAKLPAGAKYFAIRSCATDSFMLLLDDVTYTGVPNTSGLEIEGYNVYRDGVRINGATVADCSYVDPNAVKGEQYTYVVTVVYTGKGESGASNEVVITSTGGGVDGVSGGSVSITARDGRIIVLNAEGLKVTVAAADGALVYNGAGALRTEVPVNGGVYVISAGHTVRKVIVK